MAGAEPPSTSFTTGPFFISASKSITASKFALVRIHSFSASRWASLADVQPVIAAARDHRGANDLDTSSAHQGYDLLRSGDYLRRGEVAGYVVRAFKEHDVRNNGAVENVPLQTLKRRGTVTPTKHTVPRDRGDRDGLFFPLRPRREAGCKHVAPSSAGIELVETVLS